VSIHQVVSVLADLIVNQHFNAFGKEQEALDVPHSCCTVPGLLSIILKPGVPGIVIMG